MRFIFYIVLLPLFAGGLHFLLPFLPWWSVALFAGLLSLFIPLRAMKAFFAGFIGAALLWGGYALYLNFGNSGILAERMGALFGNLPGAMLPFITAVFGGVIGGLGALTGRYLQAFFEKKS